MRTPTEGKGRDGQPTWKVRYRLGGQDTSETFRRKQDAHTFAAILDGGGVADALSWLEARDARPDGQTVGEFFEHYVRQLTGVQPRTRDDYQAQWRRYLGALDRIPINTLSRADVARVVNEMERAGRSPKTIKNAIHMLSAAMNLAVDEGVIPRNPCRRVKLPNARAFVDDDEEAEAKFLTHEEFGLLLSHIPAYWRPFVVFLVGTGLRWSEATALHSRHVNIPAGTVAVRQAWKKIPPDKTAGTPGGWMIGPPKSPKSRRTVNAAMQALAAAAPLLGKPKAFVFTTERGAVVQHSNFFNRVWKPATIRASICAQHMHPDCLCATPKPNKCQIHTDTDARGHRILPAPCGCEGTLPFRPSPHDCRHTHASWLIAEGMSLEQVQDQLGHESILTTRGVYGHLLPALGVETGRMASAALARALSQGVEARAVLAIDQARAVPDQSAQADGVAADVADGREG